MAKTKIKLEFIDAGFKQILKSEGTREIVESQANAIQQRAGDLYESQVVYGYGGSRWVGFVHNIDNKGAKDEAENKTLSKAVK